MASYHTQTPWSWNIILWQLTHVSGHHRKELQSLESLELLLWWVSTQRYFVDCNLCTLCEDMFCGMSKLYKQQLNALWRNCLMWAMCLLTHKKFIRRHSYDFVSCKESSCSWCLTTCCFSPLDYEKAFDRRPSHSIRWV